MIKFKLLVILLSVCCVFGRKLKTYNVDPQKISVSGHSGGAFMAVQMHVAYSKTFMGAGIISGGPFWCAQNNLQVALGPCVNAPSMINVTYLQLITKITALTGFIDPTKHLKNDKVYIYSGTNDTLVVPGVGKAVETYYEGFIENSKNIMTEYSIASEHGFPTSNFGAKCDELNQKYYINKCHYDAAFVLLNHIYQDLKKPFGNLSLSGKLIVFNQKEFFKGVIYSGLDDFGFIYIPNKCKNGNTTCRLHVSLHGCRQGKEFIRKIYARKTGYIEVADTNNLIILFPQAKSNPSLNPQGCFDWWGYTDSAYASKFGKQTSAIRKMIERIVCGDRIASASCLNSK